MFAPNIELSPLSLAPVYLFNTYDFHISGTCTLVLLYMYTVLCINM